MKNFKLLILIFLLFYECKSRDDNFFLPEIIIETKQDTVKVGQVYEADFYLSDTSYYEIRETNTSILPIVEVNGERIQINKDNYKAHVTFNVDSNVDSNEKYEQKYWVGSITFPHPKGGDIKMTRRFYYVVSY